MSALGLLGFDGGLVSRAVHPHRTWIDGWNLDPARHQVCGIGDLDGDGQSECVITSDWGIGILKHDGAAFRAPWGAPRDTPLGEWRYDATDRLGRDRIVAVENFTGSLRRELLLWSSSAMTALEFNATGLSPTRLHRNGTRFGGWVLNTATDRYWGSGRFSRDARRAMVLTSGWGLGLVSLDFGTSLFMAAVGSRLGDWTLRASDRIPLIADLDGDGQEEILISGRAGIAVLKMIDGRLESRAVHHVGANLAGFVLEGSNRFAIADRFRGGRAQDILVINHVGLHILTLSETRLERRAFAANGSRIDGWVVNTLTDSCLPVGDLTGDAIADFLIRSPWGLGVMSVGADNQFRCRSLHPYGTALGDWPLESSDVIVGAGTFIGRTRNELLIKKPWAGSDAEPSFERTEFVNWHGNIRRAVRKVRPSNLSELVSAVRIIQARGEVVGTVGSGWSYTDCVVSNRTQALIDTSELNATLDGLLPHIIDDRTGLAGHRLVHVEAGTKIYDLNCRLQALGLALPTLGGSRGQSIAGAMGTGVHGADVSLPPFADAVRAIHLVGPGGQQWWVEPNRGSVTTRESLDRAKAHGVLDPSVKNVYDDNWFNAALVSVGCAGVIYSVVIECRPAFRLRSTTIAETWPEAQRHIRDLSFPDRIHRSLEINVNPSDSSCRVTFRDETTDPELPAASTPGISIGHILVGLGIIGPGALGFFFGAIGDYVARTQAEIAALAPLLGPAWVVTKTLESLKPVEDAHRLLIELNLVAVDPHNARRVADILPTAINLLWAIGAFVVPGRTLVAQLQAQLTSQQRPEGTFVGKSFQVMTGQPNCEQDGSQTHDETARLVESFEYAVSASRAIAFVDRLVAIITEQRRGSNAVVVNLNLRFTGRTRALLGMQKFDQTCHVEIYTFRGIRGNEAFKRQMWEIVREFRAVPHLGQLHAPEEVNVFQEMRSLQPWQTVMRAIANGNEMFWSDFPRVRGLLP